MNFIGLGVNIVINNQTGAATSQIIGNLNSIQGAANSAANAMDNFGSMTYYGMMEAGNAFNNFGDGLVKVGSIVPKGLAAMGKQVLKVGSQFETFRMTFSAFYDEATALKKLKWGMDLAATTPFNVDDVLKAQIGFKAIGVEADKMFADKDGNMRSFLEYIGDLGALRPDQGLKGALIGIRNGFGGNWRSFSQRFDLDPKQILGRDLAKDTEGIMNDIVEMSQKLAGGLMQKLEGTWAQMIENMNDQWIKFSLAIADGGAFDAAKATLTKIQTAVRSLDDDDLKQLGQNLSGIFNMIWKPIDLIVTALLKFGLFLKDILQQHPLLGKLAVGFLLISSSIVVGTGLLLKMTGGLITTVAALVLMMDAMTRLRQSSEIMNGTSMKLIKNLRRLAVVTMTGGLLFSAGIFAYQQNLFGFRDTVDAVTSRFTTSWKKVTDILNRGAVGEIGGLDKLELFLARAKMIGEVIMNIFTNDNGKEVGFSKKQFDLLNALGIWDLTVQLVMLKARLEQFWKGVKNGFSAAIGVGMKFFRETLVPIGNWLAEKIPILGEWGRKLLDVLGIEPGKTWDLDTWYKIGDAVGFAVAALLGLGAIGKLTNVVLKPFYAMFRWSGFILTRIGKLAKTMKNLTFPKTPTVPGTTPTPTPTPGTPTPPGGTVGGGNATNSTPKTVPGSGKVIPAPAVPPSNSSNLPPRTSTPSKLGKLGTAGSGLLGALGVLSGAQFAESMGDYLGDFIFGHSKGQLNLSESTLTNPVRYEDDRASFLGKVREAATAGTIVVDERAMESLAVQLGKSLPGGTTSSGTTFSGSSVSFGSTTSSTNKPLDANAMNTIMNSQFKPLPTTKSMENAFNKYLSNLPKKGDPVKIGGTVRLDEGQVSSINGNLQKISAKDFTATFSVQQTVNRIMNPSFPNPATTTPNPGGTSTSSSNKPNSLTAPGMLAKYAEGTITNKPHVGLVGEDGPEAIIPLGAKRRNRGLALWKEAGKRLGVLTDSVIPHALGGMFGEKEKQPVVSTPQPIAQKQQQTAPTTVRQGDLIIQNVSISVTGKEFVENPRAAAVKLMKELKKMLREARLRGESTTTIEQLIMDM